MGTALFREKLKELVGKSYDEMSKEEKAFVDTPGNKVLTVEEFQAKFGAKKKESKSAKGARRSADSKAGD